MILNIEYINKTNINSIIINVINKKNKQNI